MPLILLAQFFRIRCWVFFIWVVDSVKAQVNIFIESDLARCELLEVLEIKFQKEVVEVCPLLFNLLEKLLGVRTRLS